MGPSDLENRCAGDTTLTQIGQRIIRALERIDRTLCSDPQVLQALEELHSVVAREVRDRADDALTPQQLVRKRTDIAHVNAGAYNNATFANMAQRFDNERAVRRENDRGIHFVRWHIGRTTSPDSSHLARKLLRRMISSARECEDLAAVRSRDL